MEWLDFLFPGLLTTKVQFFWCDFPDEVTPISEICSSGLFEIPIQLPFGFDQSPLMYFCVSKHVELAGSLVHQVMRPQEGWLKLIYQLTSHYTSSPSFLAKTLAFDLASSLSSLLLP